jgi:hypothetical protein
VDGEETDSARGEHHQGRDVTAGGGQEARADRAGIIRPQFGSRGDMAKDEKDQTKAEPESAAMLEWIGSLSVPIELSIPQAEESLGGSLERVRVTPVRIPIPSKTMEAMITHWVGAPALIRPQATPAMTTRNPTT